MTTKLTMKSLAEDQKLFAAAQLAQATEIAAIRDFFMGKCAELETRIDELETDAFFAAEGEIINHADESKYNDHMFDKECDYLGANFTNESVRQYFKSGDESDLVPLKTLSPRAEEFKEAVHHFMREADNSKSKFSFVAFQVSE